ncbi:MAG: hypothetical protein CBB80_004185 [Synechococcus sp. TMED20]|nr:MAG: hypothetical protein CBB80_004185 [Synechococcus sp. TMED20]
MNDWEKKEREELKFNVYNPVVTYEHRAAYDQIISSLQDLSPICNNGKCKALEVTDDPQKQKQINDLMEQVEVFSKSLSETTAIFYDQLYRAKESSSDSISRSTAQIKIDMIERNLLERTCDVRWWALEKAFWECVTLANKKSKTAKVRVSGTGLDSDRKLDPKNNSSNEATLLSRAVDFACRRLEDIRNSYTLYRDLVIVSLDGYVIANSNEEKRSAVVGLNVSEELWFQGALQTNDGTEYFVQDVTSSSMETEESLIYSAALREGGSEHGKVIGAMGILFDFQGESEIILNDYLPSDKNGHTTDGYLSFFTNSNGEVISSSDENYVKTGTFPDVPRSHFRMDSTSKSMVSQGIVCGKNSLVVSQRSNGFDEYRGLGWISHYVQPYSSMFQRSELSDDYVISQQELVNSHLIPARNKDTYQEIERKKKEIQLISINGIVLATDLGNAGKSFMPIFDQITNTGDSVRGKMEMLLSEMSSDMLTQNLSALENLSQQAIDLIDRNLFERAADVRWWSTDHAFWEALETPEQVKLEQASKRLGIINASYTMYRDLVIADAAGNIIANSRPENKEKLSKLNVSEQSWFRQGKQITKSVDFGVQDVCDSELENETTSLIYCGAIIEKGAREGATLGVLGILFDWENIAKPILTGCLPRLGDKVVEGGAAFYVNRNNEIIATTDPSNFAIGTIFEAPQANAALNDGETTSGLFTLKDRRYILGSARTKGYREYKGLHWTAHIVRAIA